MDKNERGFIMSIKKILFSLTVASLAALSLVSCKKAAPEEKPQAEALENIDPAEQAAPVDTALTGIPELDEAIQELKEKHIPYAVGMGESSDNAIANSISIDNAWAQLALANAQNRSVEIIQTENGEVRRETASADISGSTVRKTVTQYDEKSGRYKVYSLVVLRIGT
jgi:DNA polymerase/3'-5' exonuclease PolX